MARWKKEKEKRTDDRVPFVFPAPATARCDFCTGANPTWQFPCETFERPDLVLPELDHKSLGGWAACDPCRVLVEAEDWTGLWERLTGPAAVEMWPLRDGVIALWKDFASRRKDAVPF